MATGISSYVDFDTTSAGFKLRVNYSQTYDASTNKSTVTVGLQFKASDWYGFYYYPDGIVKVNGVPVITMNTYQGYHMCCAPALNTWSPIKKYIGGSGNWIDRWEDAYGSVDVVHDADGKKSITIEVTGNRYSKCYFYEQEEKGGSGWGCTGSSTIELTTIPTYTLSISAGSGSTIAVSRTASGYAGTGSISAGTRLYYGDKLKITFVAKTNYRLTSTTVNGTAFTSGNTHTVTSNVSVASAAQVLASKVGAADANIGSTSTITVTKYNTNYYHSLQYEFGSLSGYITSSGGTQSTEAKFKETSVAFAVPTSFYTQIPGAKTGTCTITCRTYETSSSTTVLGTATTCTFTATAAKANCDPVITATVVDTNAVTLALTGNSNVLIRYKSNAKCTISAQPRCSSTISSMKIADSGVTGTASNNVVSGEKTFNSTDKTSFAFSATDSRGYTTTKTVTPTVISYVVLTCNPTIARPTPTGNTMTIDIRGNVYRGSFGAYSNTLTLQYRYKEVGGSYCSWKTIGASQIIFNASSYRTNGAITLEDEFDYQKSYTFQVKATDGADGNVLSTATSTKDVQRGIPVFDWGQNDFNVNADLRMYNVSLLDIIYPVGAIFVSASSTLPSPLSAGGMGWTSTSKIGDLYCWKRTS